MPTPGHLGDLVSAVHRRHTVCVVRAVILPWAAALRPLLALYARSTSLPTLSRCGCGRANSTLKSMCVGRQADNKKVRSFQRERFVDTKWQGAAAEQFIQELVVCVMAARRVGS
jgi:hypothetical protein